MTTNELIEKLKSNPGGDAGIILVDDEGREFTIEDVSLDMGGCFHSVLMLKEIKNPKEKWYRTREVYLEELNEQLELYTSDKFKDEWVEKCGDISELDEIVRKHKLHIESVKKNYKTGEIVD